MVVVDPTYTKPDEQYPLLMVSGAGDATVREPPPVLDSLLWSNTVAPRRPWTERWPEYLSTCWITVILLGISFLVFYAVGIIVIYRQEAHLLVKCNDTKPAGEVFYHNIIKRDEAFSLSKYADYLANVATLYPNLKFNLYLLVDDSSSLTHLFQHLSPYSPQTVTFYDNLYNKRELGFFQDKYSNVNITVMLLSKYMTLTPLKYRWRSIPTAYIPFYARIFSVWLNGGLGLDLVVFNQQYHSPNPLPIDRKVNAILKQHNDGIVPEKYLETLNMLEYEEETELVSSFIRNVQKMINETLSFFKTPASLINDSTENSIFDAKPIIRTNRTKRDESVTKQEKKGNDTTSHPAAVNIDLGNGMVLNEVNNNKKYIYNITANESTKNFEVVKSNSNDTDEKGVTIKPPVSNENKVEQKLLKITKHANHETRRDSDKNESTSTIPQIILFYDLSVISEPIRSDFNPVKGKNFINPPKFVVIESEGSFIASTSRKHPYLCTVLSSGCKRVPPKVAIKNALLSRCSDLSKNENNYCNSIFVL